MKTLTFTKKDLDHKNISAFCQKFFADTGLKIMAENETDIVNGYLNAVGDEVYVHLYDADAMPTKEHKTTFKKHIGADALLAVPESSKIVL